MTSEKIEVKLRGTDTWVDVSDYILIGTSFRCPRGKLLKSGKVFLDVNYTDILDRAIRPNDYVRYYIGVDDSSLELRFVGLFNKPLSVDIVNQWEVLGPGKVTLDRGVTNVFREDEGTGDQIEIIKLIIDEYFPELSYDDTTLPPKDVSIEDIQTERYQNKNVSL